MVQNGSDSKTVLGLNVGSSSGQEKACWAIGAMVRDVIDNQARAEKEGAVVALVRVLEHGSGGMVKENAAWAIGCLASKQSESSLARIGSEGTIGALVRSLERSPAGAHESIVWAISVLSGGGAATRENRARVIQVRIPLTSVQNPMASFFFCSVTSGAG